MWSKVSSRYNPASSGEKNKLNINFPRMILRIGLTETAIVRTPLPKGVFPDLSYTLEMQ
jgi:hypothetical protein